MLAADAMVQVVVAEAIMVVTAANAKAKLQLWWPRLVMVIAEAAMSVLPYAAVDVAEARGGGAGGSRGCCCGGPCLRWP